MKTVVLDVTLELGDEVDGEETCEICGEEASYELFCDGIGGWFVCGLHSIGIPYRATNGKQGKA